VLTEPEAAGKVIVAKRVDPRRRQRAVFVVAVALLLVAGAALLWQSKMRTPTPAAEVASEEKPSMARPRPGKPSADMKLYLEYMQRLEFEKKQSEEARAKLASMEREKSAEYQQILEAERRLQEERKRIEAERERLEKEKKQSEEAGAKLASMEREKSAEYQQRLETERRLQEERKRIEAERERLEKEKKQSEEARAKLASMEREKSAEYQQRLETERRLQEERKRIEAERERLEKEKKKLAYIPKTVTSAKLSLRKEPKNKLSEDAVRTMVKKYDFFDSEWNPNGTFANGFIDNGDGTLTDKATGLMWEGGGSPSARIFKRSEFYVKKLNEDKFAGYSDWRLPTVEELASLLKKDENNLIHIDPLLAKKQRSCWSADMAPDFDINRPMRQVWVVSFKKGKIRIETLANEVWSHRPPEHNYVRAVRSIK